MGIRWGGKVPVETESLLSILGRASSAVAIFDREMRYLYLSDRWREDYELGDCDVLGQVHYEVFDDVPERWKQVHARCMTGESERATDDAYVRADGREEFLRWECGPWRDATGAIGGIFVLTELTTHDRRVDEELRVIHRRLKEASRLARLGYWDWDLDTNVVVWSEEVYALFGVDSARVPLSYEDYFDAIHPDDQERVTGDVEAAIAKGGSFYFEHRIVRPDGSERHVAIDGRVVEPPTEAQTDPPTNILLMGAVQDVTERHLLEEQLRHAQKMEATGRLAGGIAHDFNNLLTAIFSFGELAKEGLKEGTARDDIDEILRAAEQARSLTAQLLAFSRRRAVMPRVIDLNDVVERAHALIQRTLGEDIRYATHPSPDLWNARIDPNALEQVLLNLAVNARDAMPNGGNLTLETSNVTLGAAETGAKGGAIPPGEYVSVVVSDDGSGMTEAVRAQIFEPFYTTKGLGRGTGLGLATCYGIIRQADGYIWVYSEPGSGTTFKIYLPRVRAATDPVEARPAPAVAKGRETVLVAEDNEQVRRVTVRVLERLGYDVRAVGSGEEALALVDGGCRPDLLLTDVVMPGINGMVLAQQVAEHRPEVRVLFMSGYTENTIVHHGVVAEGVELIQKPFEPTSLGERVRDVLDHGRPWRERG